MKLHWNYHYNVAVWWSIPFSSYSLTIVTYFLHFTVDNIARSYWYEVLQAIFKLVPRPLILISRCWTHISVGISHSKTVHTLCSSNNPCRKDYPTACVEVQYVEQLFSKIWLQLKTNKSKIEFSFPGGDQRTYGLATVAKHTQNRITSDFHGLQIEMQA